MAKNLHEKTISSIVLCHGSSPFESIGKLVKKTCLNVSDKIAMQEHCTFSVHAFMLDYSNIPKDALYTWQYFLGELHMYLKLTGSTYSLKQYMEV